MKTVAQRVFGLARFGVAAALLWYLFASGIIEWTSLRRAASWHVLVLAVPALAGALVAGSWRLCVLLRPLGLELALGASVRLTLIGMFFNLFLPGAVGGDLARIYYGAVDHRGIRAEIATVVLLDRGLGLMALLTWPLLVAPAFWPTVRASPAVSGLLLGAGAVLIGMATVGGVLLSGRVPGTRGGPAGGGRVAAYLARFAVLLETYRRNRRALVLAFLLSLVAHTCAITAALSIAGTVIPGSMPWTLTLVVPLGFLANAVPLTPSGLGVGEAAFEGLFRLVGVAGGAEILLGWRVVSLLFSMAGLGIYLRGRRRFIQASPVVEPERAAPVPAADRAGP